MGRRGISYVKKMEAVEKYKRGEGSQNSIARVKFILKVNEVDGEIYHRVLAKEKQNYPYEDNPTLEDGYMYLVKGIA